MTPVTDAINDACFWCKQQCMTCASCQMLLQCQCIRRYFCTRILGWCWRAQHMLFALISMHMQPLWTECSCQHLPLPAECHCSFAATAAGSQQMEVQMKAPSPQLPGVMPGPAAPPAAGGSLHATITPSWTGNGESFWLSGAGRRGSLLSAMHAEGPVCMLLQERLNQLEADLAQWRNKMQLGYKDPKSGELRKASSVQLRNTMRTNPDEATRKACWEVSAVLECFPDKLSCSLLTGRVQRLSMQQACCILHTPWHPAPATPAAGCEVSQPWCMTVSVKFATCRVVCPLWSSLCVPHARCVRVGTPCSAWPCLSRKACAHREPGPFPAACATFIRVQPHGPSPSRPSCHCCCTAHSSSAFWSSAGHAIHWPPHC